MNIWFWTVILSLLPVSELRGGIPFAITNGMPWYTAYILCVLVNTLVAPIAYVFLDTLHKLFYRIGFYRRIFDNFVNKSRLKLQEKVDRWGFWGIAVFVGIPLPVTGAWTGTLGAWVLGINRKKTILAVFAGAAISGTIVTSIVILGIHSFDFLIKHVG